MEQNKNDNNIPNQASYRSNLISVISPLLFVLIAIGLMIILAHYKGV